MTPVMEDLAHRYANGQINGQDYVAMQAAFFIRPRAEDTHRQRRDAFRLRAADAAAEGFQVPENFRQLVLTDAYVDRLHHNCIWLQMPEELWRLPSDPSQLVFLAFTEGQGCCHWHLLLNPDGSHCMICSEHPFGVRSNWMGSVPDYSKWVVQKGADSIEEWLYHYFKESSEHDRQYLSRLEPYHSS